MSNDPSIVPDELVKFFVGPGVNETISQRRYIHKLIKDILFAKWVHLSQSFLLISYLLHSSFLFFSDSITFFSSFVPYLLLLPSLFPDRFIGQSFLFAVSVGRVRKTTWLGTVHMELVSVTLAIIDPHTIIIAHFRIHHQGEVSVWCTIKIKHYFNDKIVSSFITCLSDKDGQIPCFCVILVPHISSSWISYTEKDNWIAIIRVLTIAPCRNMHLQLCLYGKVNFTIMSRNSDFIKVNLISTSIQSRCIHAFLVVPCVLVALTSSSVTDLYGLHALTPNKILHWHNEDTDRG